MTTSAWGELRGAIRAARVPQKWLAEQVGMTPQLLSTHLNSDDVSEPLEGFRAKVLAAVVDRARERMPK